MRPKGFTLIELLVVIAIIGVLSSVVLASLNSARAKASDAKRVADMRQVNVAMELYYDTYGNYPPSPNNCCTSASHNQNFESMAAPLVSSGILSSIPKAPNASNPYMYFDYRGLAYTDGEKAGAILVTYLEGIQPTTTPPFGSCRPFTNNWCSNTIPSTAYCLCHP